MGAGSIRGVYVTVLVMTSRTCRTLVLDLLQLCVDLASANLLALRAASQSKGDRTDRALKGDMTGVSPALDAAGEGGIRRLGKVVPAGGADMGCVGAVVTGLGDLWRRSQSHEQSVASLVAVEGALSTSLSSRSPSAESSDPELAADLTLLADPAVDVLLRAALPVRGGLAMQGLGKTGLAILRKSMYATGGVMGVLTKASSVLMAAMAGDTSPAEGSPAEGRPADARDSRHAAERGVLAETADLRASAGNEALTGVVSARVGLLAGMLGGAGGPDEPHGAGTGGGRGWERVGEAVKSSE